MRKFLPWIVVGGILLLAVVWFVSVKNGAISVDQAVKKEWGNVETSYQRRNDLIGNLVNTVKGAADFEKSTLTAVIEARAKATAVTIDPKNVTPFDLLVILNSGKPSKSLISHVKVTDPELPRLCNKLFKNVCSHL